MPTLPPDNFAVFTPYAEVKIASQTIQNQQALGLSLISHSYITVENEEFSTSSSTHTCTRGEFLYLAQSNNSSQIPES